MLKKACVLGAIVVVLATSGCISGGVMEDDIVIVKDIGTNPNSFGEIPVATNEFLEATNTDYASGQANATFLTPSANKKLKIHSVYVSTDDKLVNVVLLFNETDTVVFKLYTDKDQKAQSHTMHVTGNINESILVTCGAKTFISVTYHESEE